MPQGPPALPTKFPCWCRAVYSWGGETKRDLGFVEGDLIECLNAGDGSWWTGRLRRDRRMVGLFPSNFVQVLGEDFVPGSRSVSPIPPGASENPDRAPSSTSAAPHKQKTVFRKPFQGYKEVAGPSEVLRQRKEAASPPLQHPKPTHGVSRTNGSLTVAQNPQQQSLTRPSSRNASPQPSRPVSRGVSPEPPPGRSEPSPPPPPPPPHRIAVRSQQPPRPSPSPIPESRPTNHAYPIPARTPSPRPASPSQQDNTPSPLRDAMEGVMSSLQDMGIPRDAAPPEQHREASPFAPWSPDTIGHDRDNPGQISRPLTSLGLGGGYRVEDDGQGYEHQHNFPDRYDDGPPQLSNYVQRMESRLRQMHGQEEGNLPDMPPDDDDDDDDVPPAPPPKKPQHRYNQSIPPRRSSLRKRKSAYELSEDLLGRTSTTKSSTTNSSSGLQSNATNSTTSTGATGQSLMSGTSMGGFSATSAGSFARRGKATNLSNGRPNTAIDYSSFSGSMGNSGSDAYQDNRPHTPIATASHGSDCDSPRQGPPPSRGSIDFGKTSDSTSLFGGLTTPKSKKTGFLKKILESAKTGAATARSSMATSSRPGSASPTKGISSEAISSASPPKRGKPATNESTLGNSDWVQVRRDVNRATTPSHNELVERAERCQMMDCPVIYAVEELHESAEGDEGIDGLPIAQPTHFDVANLQLVDKSARFVNSLPPMTNPTSLAQGYVCRPHRSDAQRLRAIFTWVGEKIAWDEDTIEGIDLKRVIQVKRGCPQEVASLVSEMCRAVGIHAEMVQGYLKTPGEQADVDCLSRPNHWWNAVLVDGEWRMLDCSLASPTHPKRSLYSNANQNAAESWYFLVRPMEVCYTHIPLQAGQQHICPPISPDILLALPCGCPAFFKNGLNVPNYDTSLVRVNELEAVQVRVHVPADVECVAEVEGTAFARDADGDFYESGDVIRKRALSQPDWIRGQKRFTIKGLLPGDEGYGVLKVYAGKKGLMHSGRDITHPLAFALPIIHTGENPPYEFLIRHPTPHAQRHDLYVIQPQCARLAINNTYVFAVRQHPSSSTPAAASSSSNASEISGRVSPNPLTRPSSALSMGSSVAAISTSSSGASSTPALVSTKQSSAVREKPAKLAVQTPSGKILRLTRKADHMITTSTTSTNSQHDGTPDGSVWETVIKVSETGIWRGLVLADRSARWCVWGEWECY